MGHLQHICLLCNSHPFPQCSQGDIARVYRCKLFPLTVHHDQDNYRQDHTLQREPAVESKERKE